MRPVTLSGFDLDAALAEIDRASHENDLLEIAQTYSIGNAPVAQRVFNGAFVQSSAAGIGSVGAGETRLFDYVLPAGALVQAGMGLTVLAAGTFAANGNSKKVLLYFGSQTYQLGASTLSGVSWFARMALFKAGASSQIMVAEGMMGTTIAAPRVLALAQNDAATIDIKVTGTGVANNDIVGNVMAVSGYAGDTANALATYFSDCQKGGLNRTT